MSIPQVQKVKILYKIILRLHRGLPEELQALGNTYVKDEFKRHKNCKPNEATIFLNEWTDYALGLSKQLGIKSSSLPQKELGTPLNENMLEHFRHEQIVQLYELMVAAKGEVSEQKK